MQHLMFDVDGTLVKSYEFDENCFVAAVKDVLGHEIDSDWGSYQHVSDTGILNEHLQRKGITRNHQSVHQQVKSSFIKKIKARLLHEPAVEVPGAASSLRN